jgi:ComF family protein
MNNQRNIYKKLYSSPLFNSFVSLFFPVGCHICSRPLRENESVICWKCEANLPYTGFESDFENPVYQSIAGFINVAGAFSLLAYQRQGSVQTLIHRLKYENHPEIGRWAGGLMAQKMLRAHPKWTCDVVVPVPMHPKKLRTRGYNQAEMIAHGMAEVLGCAVVQPLEKLKSTGSQTKLKRAERSRNTDGVFALTQPTRVAHKRVLLVDDVFTTGATLRAGLMQLRTAEPAEMWAATLAFAP